MEQEEILNTKPKERMPHIIITQSICVIMVIATLLVTKYFFKKEFKRVKDWYIKNICVNTDINEVIEENYEI